eukprot:5861005-Prymnesium_polylepis.1
MLGAEFDERSPHADRPTDPNTSPPEGDAVCRSVRVGLARMLSCCVPRPSRTHRMRPPDASALSAI